ncbi:MAG: secretin N-terminal domain-containing protein [Anaerohalosphaeraceae bacterium]
MLSKNGLRKQSKQGLVAGILVVLTGMLLVAAMPAGVWAESALRSRVYGFRNTDNQRAVQLVNQLSIKVTMDAHSPAVVVLTSDDSAELTRAYTLMEMLDRKEPVEMKVLGQISESESKAQLDQLQTKLKKLLPGTLLDPPAKGGSAKPVIVDVYKGQLLVMAPAAELTEIETAWQAQQAQSPTITAAQAAPVPMAPVKATEPNTVQPIVEQPVETQVVPQPQPAEPNQAAPEPDQSGIELLNAVAAEAGAVVEPNQPAVPVDVTAIEPTPVTDANTLQPVAEGDDAALKKIVEQLMKQAAEEENAAAEPQTDTQTPPQQDTAAQPEAPAKEVDTAIPDAPVKATDAKIETAAPTQPLISKEEEELELNITLPEKVEIKTLLELVGKQLGLNYMYDDTQVRGDVMLKIHDGKIKVRDCYALLESVLRYKGFVMTRRGNLVTIVPVAQMPQFSDPKLRKEDEPIERGDVVVSSIFKLKYINVNNANNVLRQMNLGAANPAPILINETNTMIITDYAYRMDKIAEVLRIIDVKGTPKKYTSRQLQYMQASELIPRLQKLAGQLQNLTITVGTTASTVPTPRSVVVPGQPGQPGQPQPMPMAQPVVASGAQDQATVYLDSDDRTNRILMIGNEEQLKIVDELIDSLDVKQRNLRRVKEYEIKNVDASEVISVLNELGLAKVSVSKQTQQPTTGMTRPTTPGQPVQPQVMPQAASQQAAAGADQPFISIRPNTNSLLVNATTEQHEDIELVIKHIDVEQKDQRTIREYEIQNVDAMEIVSTLGDLGIISKDSVSSITGSKGSMYGTSSTSRMGSSYGSTGTSRTMPGQMTQPGIQQPGQEPTAFLSLPTAEGGTVREMITSEPQISILESTNSLLIHATPRQHAAVSLVISHVDRILEQVTTPYVVYQLENQKPEELVTTLEDLISETLERASKTAAASPDAKIQTAQTSSPSPALPNLQGERIRVIADKASNSLIVYANKKNQLWISELIKELDQYRPQVLLDCTLVEITKDDQFTMDLDVISKKYGLTTPFKQLTNPITGNTSVTNTGGTALEGTFSSASETNPFTAFYGDNNIQALLKLMDKKEYGRVLARPSILVKDNEEGMIKSEKITYVAEQTSNIISNGTNAPTTTTDVSFKDYMAGITLTITPHISSEKIMQLEIELDRTDFIPGATTTKIGLTEYPKPLDTTSSNVKTWSIVPSGATIILGGIETVNQNKTNTKVPLLGDIPLIGLLFRGVDQSDNQSKLYIFVKANIVKPGDEMTGKSDIEKISQKKRKAFEEDEARFQGLDALPGFKPNPILPEKVLEDDEYIQELKDKQASLPSNTVTVEIQ